MSIENLFKSEMKHYDWRNLTAPSNHNINIIQTAFNCCGSENGYEDWDKLRNNGTVPDIPIGAFPWSCCRQNIGDVLHAKPEFCGLNEVEKQLNCPIAFRRHLIELKTNLVTQQIILGQVLIIEAITIAMFIYKMIRSRKLVRYHQTPENVYSLSEE